MTKTTSGVILSIMKDKTCKRGDLIRKALRENPKLTFNAATSALSRMRDRGIVQILGVGHNQVVTRIGDGQMRAQLPPPESFKGCDYKAE